MCGALQILGLKQILRQSQQVMRLHAVKLTDAFDLDDYALDSDIGRYDGDVYTALIDRARSAPFNQTALGPISDVLLKGLHQKSKL